MDANGNAVDLLALLAEVSAPDFLEKNPDIAAEIAADAAKEEARKTAALRRQGLTKDACGKCRGTGHLECFRHIAGGNCFDCNGTGVVRMGVL